MPIYSFSSRSNTSTFSIICQRHFLEYADSVSVLSTMSKSIAEVRKACGGRSTGSLCCGGGPRAPPSTLGPCCGGGVALYAPSYSVRMY
jgi:hypothetical protein